MRWRFYDSEDPAEAARHRETVERIDQWWRTFLRCRADIEEHIERGDRSGAGAFVSDALQWVHPGLGWDLGRAHDGPGYRLVITPECARFLRPLATTILERAPLVPGWEIHAYRVPLPPDEALRAVRERCGREPDPEMRVRAMRASLHRVDLLFLSSATSGPDDDAAWAVAMAAAEALLGEARMDHWIGGVDVDAPASGDERLRWSVPLARVRQLIDAAIATIQADLPDCASSDWVRGDIFRPIRRLPAEAEDYPAQGDLYEGSVVELYAPLLETAPLASPFTSERFTRSGERFCYVKTELEGRRRFPFLDAEDMAEHADNVLRRAGHGCTFGWGAGLRYAYANLALRDVDRGIGELRAALRDAGIGRRSWILFFDTDWQAEWVGIHPETPAPPAVEQS